MSAEKDPLSANEAAKFFGLSLKMSGRHTQSGVIPAKKAGRRGVFSQAK